MARTKSSKLASMPLDTPLQGFVEKNERQFYLMYLPANRASVTVSLTSVQGDVDLYAKANHSTTFYEKDADFSGMAAGDDIFTISWSDSVVRDQCGAQANNVACPFSIMVAGFSDSDFSIVAASNGTAQQLQDGTSFPGDVPAGKFAYYYYRMEGEKKPITVSIVTLNGDPDIFASFAHEYPTAANAEYRSSGFGQQTIVAEPSDESYQQCGNPCLLHITVLAFGD